MFILEKPYVSDLILHTASALNIPVLKNEMSLSMPIQNGISLIDQAIAVEKIKNGEITKKC